MPKGIKGRMDSPRKQVLNLDKRLKSAGIRTADVMSAARVDYSTWTRWKQGKLVPRMNSWIRVSRAAEASLARQNNPAA